MLPVIIPHNPAVFNRGSNTIKISQSCDGVVKSEVENSIMFISVLSIKYVLTIATTSNIIVSPTR